MKTTPESSVAKFVIGQHVTWHYQPAGGLGYEITAQAKVIKIGKARIEIEVPNSDGLLVQRWVSTSSLAPDEVTAAQPAPPGPVGLQGKAQTLQPRAELTAPRYPSMRENAAPFLEHGKLRFATRFELPQAATHHKKKRQEPDPNVPPRTLSDDQLREEAAWRQVQETGKPLIFEGTLLLPPNMSLWDAIELLPDDIRDQTSEIAQNGMARIVVRMINHIRGEIEERAKQSGDLDKWNSFSYAAQMAIAESVFRRQFGWTDKPLEELLAGIGGKFFRILLNADITGEDLVGPLDPQAIQQGEWRRKWSKFAACDLALLDEVWKASPQVSNMLLDGLEERLVTDGDEDRPIPLISAIAASNEIPEDKAVQAAYDRFLVRLSVGYVRDPDDFRALLISNAGTQMMQPAITTDDIRLLAATAEAMSFNPPAEMIEKMTEIWQTIGQGQLSDRRWKKTLKLAMAYALLCDETPSPRHLGVGRWTLWTEPDEETDVRNTILGLTDPVGGDVLDCEALLADLKAKANNLTGMKLNERAEVAGKARKLITRVQKLQSNSDAKPYAARLNSVVNEANGIVSQVLDLMSGGA